MWSKKSIFAPENRKYMASEIRNPQLWQDGRLKIDWVRHHMPLLNSLEEEFKATQPFRGLKVALSVHLEAKTAYLCEVLAAGGAEMYVTGSNPLSTQDDVAAALVEAGLNVFDAAFENAAYDIVFALTLNAVLLEYAVFEQSDTAFQFFGVDDDSGSLSRVALAEPEKVFDSVNHFGNKRQGFRLRLEFFTW